MRGNELLDKIELIDLSYVEAADKKPAQKVKTWVKGCALAACLCLVIGAATVILHFAGNRDGLQMKTTAKIMYGCEDGAVPSFMSGSLQFLTEAEMFHREKMYVFRGTVKELTNVTIDYNGYKEVRCIATVAIEKVYKGTISAGEEIKMLIPCAIGNKGMQVEDSGIISQLECGMEGIFMPWSYDKNAYIEMNGAVLMLQDLAPCGLADGMRWTFLATGYGVRYLRSAYPGAHNAKSLDDIEAYVIEMLK